MKFRRQLVCVLWMAASGTSLLAQIPLKPGTVEISPYTGGTFDFPGAGSAVGICLTTGPCTFQVNRGRRTQPVVGGEIGVAVRRFLWLYGDYGYMFKDRQESTVTVTAGGRQFTDTNTTNRQYWTATGGVELSFPTIHRIVPFFRVGAGSVHQSYNSFTNPNYLQLYPSRRVNTDTITAGTAGGGVRWYWKENQGLRILADGFFLGHGVDQLAPPASGTGFAFISRRSGGRITVGYFYQFGHGH